MSQQAATQSCFMLLQSRVVGSRYARGAPSQRLPDHNMSEHGICLNPGVVRQVSETQAWQGRLCEWLPHAVVVMA